MCTAFLLQKMAVDVLSRAGFKMFGHVFSKRTLWIGLSSAYAVGVAFFPMLLVDGTSAITQSGLQGGDGEKHTHSFYNFPYDLPRPNPDSLCKGNCKNKGFLPAFFLQARTHGARLAGATPIARVIDYMATACLAARSAGRTRRQRAKRWTHTARYTLRA